MQLRIPIRNQEELIEHIAFILNFHSKNKIILGQIFRLYQHMGSMSSVIMETTKINDWNYITTRKVVLKLLEFNILVKKDDRFFFDPDLDTTNNQIEFIIKIEKTEYQSEAELMIPVTMTVEDNDVPAQAERSEAVINPRYQHLFVDNSID